MSQPDVQFSTYCYTFKENVSTNEIRLFDTVKIAIIILSFD